MFILGVRALLGYLFLIVPLWQKPQKVRVTTFPTIHGAKEVKI